MFAGASPITPPPLRQKRTRRAGCFPPKSITRPTVLSPFPIPARAATRGAEAATLARDGLRRLPVSPSLRAAHYPGGPATGAFVGYSPVGRGLPLISGGSASTLHFRGLLRLHSRSARKVAQPPKAAFVTGLRSRRLPDKTACQLPDQTDNCLGGSFLHWCYAPSGRRRFAGLEHDPTLVIGSACGQDRRYRRDHMGVLLAVNSRGPGRLKPYLRTYSDTMSNRTTASVIQLPS